MIVDQRSLDLDQIDPNPWQARKEEDQAHIGELAQSILEVGLMQVPTGRAKDGRVQLAFGHSRLAAFRLLVSQGHDEYSLFPVNIKTLDDEQMAVAAFTENEKRKDLNPVDRANAIQKMIGDFGWTQQDVADKLKIDRSSVANALRMLRVPVDVLSAVENGNLPVRAAMALLPYYELTPAELSILESKDPDAAESISVARSGMLTSDVIRKMVDGMIELVRPSPEPVLVQEESTVGGQEAIEGQENVLTVETPTDEPEPNIATIGEATENEGEPEVATIGGEPEEAEESPESPQTGAMPKTKSTQASKTPKATAMPAKPAEPPAPQPVSAVLEGETLFTVKWMANGVMVGLQKFGQPPAMRFLKELHGADIPFLLKELGIE